MLCRDERRHLPSIVCDTIRACWPGPFGISIVQNPQASVIRLPSKSSLQRWYVNADIALMLASRVRFEGLLSCGVSTWWGADSSTQFGEQFFLSGFAYCLDKDLRSIRAAARVLEQSGQHDLETRRPVVLALDNIRQHSLCPQVQVDESVVAKLQSQLFLAVLDVGGPSMPLLLKSAVSGTYDQGTENALADAQSDSLDIALPEFPRDSIHDDFDDDRNVGPSIENVLGNQDLPPEQDRMFLWNSKLRISGLLHTLHKAEERAHAQMLDFKLWWMQFRQVLMLFTRKSKNKLFVRSCVIKKMPSAKSKMNVMISEPDKARWNTATKCSQSLGRRMYELVMCWDKELFGADSRETMDDADDGDGDDDEFKIGLSIVTFAINSKRFWGLTFVVVQKGEAFGIFRAQMESCPCHWHIFRDMSFAQQSAYIRLRNNSRGHPVIQRHSRSDTASQPKRHSLHSPPQEKQIHTNTHVSNRSNSGSEPFWGCPAILEFAVQMCV